MNISESFELRNCVSCGKEFQSYWVRGAMLRRCPTCSDIKQRRPSIVIERGVDFSQVCVVESLPGAWELFQSSPKDAPCWKISVRGACWGVSWNGRIDIYSHNSLAPKVGDVVLLEACVSVHRRSDLPENPLEIREYIRLSAAGMQPEPDKLPKLIWATASWKTTLKGFGRQWRHSLKGVPLWEKRLSGQCRSGRYGTEGSLALVDAEHPLWVADGENQPREIDMLPKELKVRQGDAYPIQFSEAELEAMPLIDSQVIMFSDNFSEGTLTLDWDFMGSRFWNLSEEVQELIMEKLGVDSLSN